jgi:hypothetical protein
MERDSDPLAQKKDVTRELICPFGLIAPSNSPLSAPSRWLRLDPDWIEDAPKEI